MDTSSLSPSEHPHRAPPAEPGSGPAPAADGARVRSGLAAEVRESVLLLGFAVGVTLGLTTAAQAALALLG